MFTKKAERFVEGYLYRARGHRVLEQSVLAEGERQGFSARTLRRAGKALGVRMYRDLWELDPGRAAELTAREIASLGQRPVPVTERDLTRQVG
ncbi:MAG TPA: hypothetical protein VFN48_11025 [Solirubrobacteraceae bacterium]|nr:hypothetical protein [Solirubrobacteraceae bacterium]